jgi:hypothetical protein
MCRELGESQNRAEEALEEYIKGGLPDAARLSGLGKGASRAIACINEAYLALARLARGDLNPDVSDGNALAAPVVELAGLLRGISGGLASLLDGRRADFLNYPGETAGLFNLLAGRISERGAGEEEAWADALQLASIETGLGGEVLSAGGQGRLLLSLGSPTLMGYLASFGKGEWDILSGSKGLFPLKRTVEGPDGAYSVATGTRIGEGGDARFAHVVEPLALEGRAWGAGDIGALPGEGPFLAALVSVSCPTDREREMAIERAVERSLPFLRAYDRYKRTGLGEAAFVFSGAGEKFRPYCESFLRFSAQQALFDAAGSGKSSFQTAALPFCGPFESALRELRASLQ